jgi:hypothetical protein
MRGLDTLVSILSSLLDWLMRAGVAGVASWTLGLIFAWSGFQKVRKPRLAAMAMVDFRVTRRARRGWGIALGLSELGISLLLLAPPARTWGLGLSTLALWSFCVLLGRSLLSGDQFPCYCFGQSNGDLSIRTLVRTSLLAMTSSLLLVRALVLRPVAVPIDTDYLAEGLIALSLLCSAVLLAGLARLLQLGRRTREALT